MGPIQTYVISGNIAAGKSSTGPILAKQLGGLYIAEPVDQWRKDGKLQEFYETNDAFKFQTYVIRTRVNAFNWAITEWKHSHNGNDPELIVMDRWLEDDLVFAEVTHEQGLMTDEQLTSYKKLNLDLSRSLRGRLSIRKIFIDIPPIECYRRMRRRGRHEEQKITLEYLTLLDKTLRDRKFDVSHASGSASQEETAMRLCEIINQRYRPTIIAGHGTNGCCGYSFFDTDEDVKLFLWAVADRTLVVKKKNYDKLPTILKKELDISGAVCIDNALNPGPEHVYLYEWPNGVVGNLTLLNYERPATDINPIMIGKEWRKANTMDNIDTFVTHFN